ncbi:MAG: hypothetical protein IJ646_06560 [Clostridia bacterium]|nr:hypothetical protein [Clostridia bacterium]
MKRSLALLTALCLLLTCLALAEQAGDLSFPANAEQVETADEYVEAPPAEEVLDDDIEEAHDEVEMELVGDAPTAVPEVTPEAVQTVTPEPTLEPTPEPETAPQLNLDYEIEGWYYTLYVGDIDAYLEDIPLYFVNGVYDLPWMELTDFCDLMTTLAAEFQGDADYDLSVDASEEGKVYMNRENDYYALADFVNGKVTFSDFDAFCHPSAAGPLLDALTESGFSESGEPELFQRVLDASYDRYGVNLVLDLAAYGIDMVAQEGGYYLPLQTLNDFICRPTTGYNLLFNGDALFLASLGLLGDDEGHTPLGEYYYSVDPDTLSEQLADYGYCELCLMLDNLYGLKDAHDIDSFDQLFWQIGYDELLKDQDAVVSDTALASFVHQHLDDIHSGFGAWSCKAGADPDTKDAEEQLAEVGGRLFENGISYRRSDAQEERFRAAREVAYPDGIPGYEEVGNTAYVTFDTFSMYGDPADYYADPTAVSEEEDTLSLLIRAHKQITRPDSPIENVVLDLSCNTGGDAEAAVFALGWFLGDAPFSVKNTTTGALSTASYRADVNLDRTFNEDDTVTDKNLYCLISPVSFSCGNLVPAVFKNTRSVTLLGRASGGGSCIVSPVSTAWGTLFDISGTLRLSFMQNGSFYDIDRGVEPDLYIDDLADFYDRAALTDYINKLF